MLIIMPRERVLMLDKRYLDVWTESEFFVARLGNPFNTA